VTQIDTIRKILRGFETGELITTREIISSTGFKEPSVRRLTGNLVETGEISRIEPGLFRKEEGDGELNEIFHRKFIGTAKYQNKPRQWFAVTYEANDIDRETELLRGLKQHLNEHFVDATGDTGYSDQVTETFDPNYVYPSIQVGEL